MCKIRQIGNLLKNQMSVNDFKGLWNLLEPLEGFKRLPEGRFQTLI